MRKRLLVVTAATSLALGMSAGSALAHFNAAAGKAVGPDPTSRGHMGMECGAQGGQLAPLAPAVICPADR